MSAAPRPGRARAARATGAVAALGFVVLAALVAGHWSPLMALDGTVASWTARSSDGHRTVTEGLRVWTACFGPATWLLVSLGLAGLLAARRRRRAAAAVLASAVAATVVEYAGELLLPRARPFATGSPAGVEAATGGSFPSGHGLTSLVGCGVLLWAAAPFLGPRARGAALGVAVVVVVVTGVSRIVLRAHWASDVGGGWLAAIAVLGLVGPLVSSTRSPGISGQMSENR